MPNHEFITYTNYLKMKLLWYETNGNKYQKFMNKHFDFTLECYLSWILSHISIENLKIILNIFMYKRYMTRDVKTFNMIKNMNKDETIRLIIMYIKIEMWENFDIPFIGVFGLFGGSIFLTSLAYYITKWENLRNINKNWMIKRIETSKYHKFLYMNLWKLDIYKYKFFNIRRSNIIRQKTKNFIDLIILLIYKK